MDGCRALCGPQGTDGHMNALCRPAAMAGEAHLVPFRTQKLSPRAPMVLRRESVGEQDAAGQQRAFVPEREGSASALPSLCLHMRSLAEGPLHHAGAASAICYSVSGSSGRPNSFLSAWKRAFSFSFTGLDVSFRVWCITSASLSTSSKGLSIRSLLSWL